jgi:hypothetical protein
MPTRSPPLTFTLGPFWGVLNFEAPNQELFMSKKRDQRTGSTAVEHCTACDAELSPNRHVIHIDWVHVSMLKGSLLPPCHRSLNFCSLACLNRVLARRNSDGEALVHDGTPIGQSCSDVLEGLQAVIDKIHDAQDVDGIYPVQRIVVDLQGYTEQRFLER